MSYWEYLGRLAWDVQVESDHLVLHFGGPSGLVQSSWELEQILEFVSEPGELEEERGRARIELLKRLEAMGIAPPQKYTAPE